MDNEKQSYMEIIIQIMPNVQTDNYFILRNLPTNTKILKFNYEQDNSLYGYCWTHYKKCCEIKNNECFITNNTLILDPVLFMDLPSTVNDIVLNVRFSPYSFINKASLVIDKIKFHPRIKITIIYSIRKKTLLIEKISMDHKVSELSIKTPDYTNLQMTDEIIEYLNKKTIFLTSKK
jgi:hypothetical protein